MSDSNGSEQSKARLGVVAAGVGAILLYFGSLWLASVVGIRDGAQQQAEYRCEADEKCDKPSLEQDIRAANAAELSADLGIAQVALGFASVLGLFGTIYYAHKAWKETQQAAKFAAETLQHARDVSKVELRPWLSIDIDPVYINVNELALTFRHKIVVKNLGSTVARSVGVYFTTVYSGDVSDEEIDAQYEKWWAARQDAASVVMPGESIPYKYVGGRHHSAVPWSSQMDGEEVVWPLILVAVFYKSDMGKDWLRTHRIFNIGISREGIGIGGVRRAFGRVKPPELVAQNQGAADAT